MYGLILENLADFIRQSYGEEKWDFIRRQAGVEQPSFSVHQVYPENLIPKLAKKAQQILGLTEREFMDEMGVQFVAFVSQYGYDRVLSVLGRHMRDFLNGLDNLHEYLKFSYPKMRAPSFFCENETKQGLVLHYRSRRRGFVYYTMGQIRQVAKHFYNKDMIIELIKEEILFDTTHVTFQLTFDNRAFTFASLAMTREEKHLPISAAVLFEIFPFCLVFGVDMIVRSIGNSLMVILPELLGKKVTNWFDLVRPLITFKFHTILNRTNNIFELVTVKAVFSERGAEKHKHHIVFNVDNESQERSLKLKELEYKRQMEEEGGMDKFDDDEFEETGKDAAQQIFKLGEGGRLILDNVELRLKGQMIYMENWRMIMFLGTPVMPDLTSLIAAGLYINDLSMHDFSRDLMLAGTQQSVELKLALDQEQQKSKKLEESMKKLDEEMKRTDELLYQMIPKQVADRLRTGENPIDTCEMFDSVSVLFSDVVTFTEICSRITPMEVVSMLNAMYSIFDTLTEKNKVYKVETIGDAYMVVSGAPEKAANHAEKVCDMALDMVDAITDLKDPSTGSHLKIRVGIHSGAVVAGIVGLKMPRYCLFGDSVNTASRMESTSEGMKIHISQSTKEALTKIYEVEERGEVQVKGKGSMKTYWLRKKVGRSPLDKAVFAQTMKMLGLGKTDGDTAPTVQAPPHIEPPNPSINLQKPREVVLSATSEDRKTYSPITFEEVAKKSAANSPARSAISRGSRSTRSNSINIMALRVQSPSDVFGSAIFDVDDNDSLDAQSDAGSVDFTGLVHASESVRMGTAPAKTGGYKPPTVFGSQEDMSYPASPSHSAPALILKKKNRDRVEIMEISDEPVREPEKLQVKEDVEERLKKAARKIAKHETVTVEKKVDISTKAVNTEPPKEEIKRTTIPPSSISDSNIVRHQEKSTSPKERASPLIRLTGLGRSTKKVAHKSTEFGTNNNSTDNQCCGSFTANSNKNKVVSTSCTIS